jgi:hypothetical protein
MFFLNRVLPPCPLQGRFEWLSNDVVNMIQISLAAVLAIGLQLALGLP